MYSDLGWPGDTFAVAGDRAVLSVETKSMLHIDVVPFVD